MTTITLTASADFGQSGQYVARVTGRDSKYTFAREFIGRKSGKRNEYTEATVDDTGLYELRNVERKAGKVDRYRLVLRHGDGLVRLTADRDDAMKIARAIDEGRAFDEIVRTEDGETYAILSPAAAKRAETAQTIESATEACWAILEALPEREAKKVLTTLRARVSPPKSAASETDMSPPKSAAASEADGQGASETDMSPPKSAAASEADGQGE